MEYIAEIDNVHELTLIGGMCARDCADLLARVGLFPVEVDGQVEIGFSLVEARWLGKHFNELAVGIAASCSQDCTEREGYFMACAGHSSRLFAWIERKFFKTTHRTRQMQINPRVPLSFDLKLAGAPLFGAYMADARQAKRTVDDGWELPVYLPARSPVPQSKRHKFHARVRGMTDIYSFNEGDQVRFDDPGGDEAWTQLARSYIACKEWHVRLNATHARSKTRAEPIER